MLRIHRLRERSLSEHTVVAVILSLVAGAVNASGLLAAGAMTSHMTGNLTRVGEGFSSARASALEPALLIAWFFAGALLATICASALLGRGHEPVPALLLAEAALLSAAGLAAWPQAHASQVTELLCFAMGWQNAIITKVSRAVVRTTHITGTLTDLGIEAAHLLLGSGTREASRTVHGDGGRAALHVSILAMFLLGAAVGPLLYARVGYRALLLPSALLVLLVGVDRWRAQRGVPELR